MAMRLSAVCTRTLAILCLQGIPVAHALCPDKLPVALLEECIVAEGLGREYPVEKALAEWRQRHPGKTPDASVSASDALSAAPQRQPASSP